MQEEENAADIPLAESLWASVLRTACQELFWDIWFKIMRKPTQAVRWMERTSKQVARSTQAQWGGGHSQSCGGGFASQGILPFPPERTLTALVFSGLKGSRMNSPERPPRQWLSREGSSSPEQWLNLMSMKQSLQSSAFTLLISRSEGKKLYKFCRK